ncbi:hypothetical protein [Paraburkholderia sp. RAU6.4a]|uniref:hypothetical protein n=1 Tax=Paraburkholderia sp. RAU6.4a TaxID=2991067 RepID=UPI003D1B9AF5
MRVAEQCRLELVAAKPRADFLGVVDGQQVGFARMRLVAEREVGAADSFVGPQAVVVGVAGIAALAQQRFERVFRILGLAFGQQQIAFDAPVGGREFRGGRCADGIEGLARARRIALGELRVDDRHQHQRFVTRRGGRERVFVGGQRLLRLAPAQRDIAEHLVGRSKDLLGRLRRRSERIAGVAFGVVEVAGIAVGDREIAFGQGRQIRIVGLPGHHQGARRGIDAVAEVAALGSRDGHAAIVVGREFDAVSRQQQTSLGRQRVDRFGVALAFIGLTKAERLGRKGHGARGPRRGGGRASGQRIARRAQQHRAHDERARDPRRVDPVRPCDDRAPRVASHDAVCHPAR